MSLYAMLVVILSLSGVSMVALAAGEYVPALAVRRIRAKPPSQPRNAAFFGRAAANALLPITLVFAFAYLLYPLLFDDAWPSVGRFLWEVAAVLLLYDLGYYAVHRFLFHAWGPLRSVHAVHHRSLRPAALDSLNLHPVETTIGIALLVVSTLVVGPVSVHSFAAIFLVYTQLNILNHCGSDPVWRILRPLGYMARKHDLHHTSMRAGNFASLVPLYDAVFGTAEPEERAA